MLLFNNDIYIYLFTLLYLPILRFLYDYLIAKVTKNIQRKKLSRANFVLYGFIVVVKEYLLPRKTYQNARQKGTFRNAKGALLRSRRPCAAGRLYRMMTFDVDTWPS